MPSGNLEPSYDCPAFPEALVASCPVFNDGDRQYLKSRLNEIRDSSDPLARAKGIIIESRDVQNMNLQVQDEYYQKMQEAQASVVVLASIVVFLVLLIALYLFRKYRLKIVKR